MVKEGGELVRRQSGQEVDRMMSSASVQDTWWLGRWWPGNLLWPFLFVMLYCAVWWRHGSEYGRARVPGGPADLPWPLPLSFPSLFLRTELSSQGSGPWCFEFGWMFCSSDIWRFQGEVPTLLLWAGLSQAGVIDLCSRQFLEAH